MATYWISGGNKLPWMKPLPCFLGKTPAAKEIWLVDPAPAVIGKYEKAVEALNSFMQASGLACKPEEVSNLKGDIARAEFINHFKEVQRLKTQLDQYTDLSNDNKAKIEQLLPEESLRSFKGAYLETAKRLKDKQTKEGETADPAVQQLDFELVLFASAIVDYDYIMGLIAKFTQNKPSKQKMTREQLINLLSSSANLMEEQEDIVAYINSLEEGKGRSVTEIQEGYQEFKEEKSAAALAAVAQKYGLETAALQRFVDGIMSRMIFARRTTKRFVSALRTGLERPHKKRTPFNGRLNPSIKKTGPGARNIRIICV